MKVPTMIAGMVALILVHIFVLTQVQNGLDFSFGINTVLLSSIVVLLQAVSLWIAYIIAEPVYCYVYKILAIYLGFGLNVFVGAVIYFTLAFFMNVNVIVCIILYIVYPICICIYGMKNAKQMNVDRINLKYPGLQKKMTICHLSDIHLGAIYQKWFVQKIVDKILELKPDIVVITGDLADGSLRVKSDWMSPFDTLSIPVLYITGNHEKIHGKTPMLTAVQGTRINYVGNTNYEFNGVNFVGIDFEYDLKKRLKELVPRGQNKNVPNVLLYHIPELKPKDLEEFDIFLFLAGHTHGGQVFPFQPLVYLGNKCFGGLYSYNNHHIYVSTGVGTALPPMRIGSKSVIAMITLEG